MHSKILRVRCMCKGRHINHLQEASLLSVKNGSNQYKGTVKN